ncbi:MAG TPA: hypothetical protein VE596_15540 [Gaiellaceae bacterium]|jgi:hypothetical protein|nr:hypothetical protein [Gaiellaceae bacterium]
MQRGSLVLAVLLVAASAALTRELVTRHGVGPLEYAVGGLLLAVLLLTATFISRRALRRV